MNTNTINHTEHLNNENGSTLIIALMVMMLLTVLGISATNTAVTELQIATNDQAHKMAFYDADAGVQYTLGLIKQDIINDTDIKDIDLTSNKYTNPPNNNFKFSIFYKGLPWTNTGPYSFTSTGSGPGNAQVVIEASFQRKISNPINFAAFSDKKTDTKNSGTTLSFDSNSTDSTKNDPSDPSFQPTHEADVGSNDWLVTHNGAMIDGDGVFGEQSDGSSTVDNIHSGTTFYGTAGVDAGRIDPDPLGINSGGIYDPTTYSVSNDNTTYATINGNPVAGDTIVTNNGDTVTLEGKAGGSNFYFTSVDLKNSVNLEIDISSGPVNIFLEGGFDAKNGSTINVIDTSGNPGKATQFAIFSNSSDKIDFKHNSEFRGLVYAPLADIDMKNSSAVYGSIWGKTVDIKNSGTLYYDTALNDKYTTVTNDLSLVSWKEI